MSGLSDAVERRNWNGGSYSSWGGASTVTLPHGANEYFTALSLSYAGDYNTGHPGDVEHSFLHYLDDGEILRYSGVIIPLLSELQVRLLTENPWTGKKLNSAADYSSVTLTFQMTGHWDNCNCADGKHLPANAGETSSGQFGPIAYFYYSQPLPLAFGANYDGSAINNYAPTLSATGQTVYQGASTSTTIGSMLRFYYPPGSITRSDIVTDQWGVASLPFDLTQSCYAAYIELTDSAFSIDPENTTYYGVPLSDSSAVQYSYVTKEGRTFLRLSFTDDYIRDARFTTDKRFRCYLYDDRANLAGNIKLAFLSLPGTRLGTHYPVGEMYLDYSALLEAYNAHTDADPASPTCGEVVGAKDGITKYYFRDNPYLVEDTLGLSSTAVSGKKLYGFNFGQGGDNEYSVRVLAADKLGCSLYPGKLNSNWDFNGKTEYYTEQAGSLNALVTMTGLQRSITGVTAYVTLPRDGLSISYTAYDENNQEVTRTAVSDRSLYLTAAPEIAMQNDGDGTMGELSYAYTTDAAPGADSAWSAAAPTTAEGWRAVTGVRLAVASMPANSAIDFRLKLAADEKSDLTVYRSFAGGTASFSYDDGSGAVVQNSLLPLAEWDYENYSLSAGRVWWDSYDESGSLTANREAGIAGATVRLYDTDGATLISSAETASDGSFILYSWKGGEGLVFEALAPAGATATRKSSAAIGASGTDSDISRDTNRATLGRISSSGLKNLSAGFVRLPEISGDDLVLAVGDTAPLTAVLKEYLGMDLAVGSYDLSFSQTANPTVATVDLGQNGANATETVTGSGDTHSAARSVSGLKAGKTSLTVSTVNLLGDTVTKTFNITVEDTAPFSFTKTDENGAALPGAQFKLYRSGCGTEHEHTDACFAPVQEAGADKVWVSGADGLVDFGRLATGSYRLYEVKAPAGYALPNGYWTVTVDARSETQPFTISAAGSIPAFYLKDGAYCLPNHPRSVLPSSGGVGTVLFTVGGVALIGGALLLLALPGKKRRGKPDNSGINSEAVNK